METRDNAEVMLTVFRAVERRDGEGFKALCQPDVALHWPSPLPYSGSFQAGAAETREGPNWDETWSPLQPTEAERRMDARVVAADNDEVVVLWRQRALRRQVASGAGRDAAAAPGASYVASAAGALQLRRAFASALQLLATGA